MEAKRLLKMREAAVFTGLSPNKLRALIKVGTLPFRNVSKGARPSYRFDVKALEKWIAQLPGRDAENLSKRDIERN